MNVLPLGGATLAVTRQDVFTVLAVVATLATIALLAVTLLGERRRTTAARERRRRSPAGPDARAALELFGSALAATLDLRALGSVILRATVDATGAAGGRMLEQGVETSRAGEQPADGGALVFELGSDTTLELFLPRAGFDDETRQLAEWLAAQAAIALENARLHHVVQRQAVTDDLTGLVNRRRFMESLAAEVARSDRFGTPVSLVLADLDDFKRVNDAYGHAVGDGFLTSFALALQAQVRDIDLGARLGGEEFGILLPETDLEGAMALAERLRSALTQRPVDVSGILLPVSASFGVAQYAPPEAASELLRRADAALYRAKKEGKNRVAAAAV